MPLRLSALQIGDGVAGRCTARGWTGMSATAETQCRMMLRHWVMVHDIHLGQIININPYWIRHGLYSLYEFALDAVRCRTWKSCRALAPSTALIFFCRWYFRYEVASQSLFHSMGCYTLFNIWIILHNPIIFSWPLLVRCCGGRSNLCRSSTRILMIRQLHSILKRYWKQTWF